VGNHFLWNITNQWPSSLGCHTCTRNEDIFHLLTIKKRSYQQMLKIKKYKQSQF
jgi:hypothetical protein